MRTLFLLLLAGTAAADGITWSESLEAAEKDGRPVLLFFTFDTCHWCHVLEQQTFPDPKVVEASSKFAWVHVDRDKCPDLVKTFDVSAYPTLLLLGRKREKVHRFSGFKKPEEFLSELKEGERRYALYAKGEEWDDPLPRAPSLLDEGTVELLPAPSDEIPNGLVFVGKDLFVIQQQTLYRFDVKTAEVKARHDLEGLPRDLCTDGKVLYVLDYGWTAGEPIRVLDPETGKTVRTIVTEENRKNKSSGAAGIAWRKGKLWVLDGMPGLLREVDPETGAVVRTVDVGARWLGGLCDDGDRLWVGSRDALLCVDPEIGKVVRKVSVHYPLRALCAQDGTLYAMEQPEFGHDKDHKPTRVWPKKFAIHKITLR